MIEQKVMIQNKLGLHARPAALLVETSSKYDAEVTLTKDGLEVNGKSIMSVLMLAAEYESEIVIRTDGKEEKEAMEALVSLLESKFGEE